MHRATFGSNAFASFDVEAVRTFFQVFEATDEEAELCWADAVACRTFFQVFESKSFRDEEAEFCCSEEAEVTGSAVSEPDERWCSSQRAYESPKLEIMGFC